MTAEKKERVVSSNPPRKATRQGYLDSQYTRIEDQRQYAQRRQELLTEAFVWQAEGVAVVPAQPQSKACLLSWRQFEQQQPEEKRIRRWFDSGIMNLAIVCGTGGLLVLDFDDPAQHQAWQEKVGELAVTYTETTGRGVHLFYQVDRPETRRFVECEALGLGHLCLVAPSIHPNGTPYRSPDPLQPITQTTTDKLFSLLSEIESPSQAAAAAAAEPQTPAERDDLVSRIKAALPILPYAQALTELKPSGRGTRWWIGKCPFHDDEQPSLWVDARRGVWRCYAPSCRGHRGGDAINLFAVENRIDVHEAIRRLAKELLP